MIAAEIVSDLDGVFLRLDTNWDIVSGIAVGVMLFFLARKLFMRGI